MFLRFVFLLITRVGSWLRLSQRKEAWKTAEILILRHQLAQARPLRQSHGRDQPATRHQVRVVEGRGDGRESMRNSHLVDAPLIC